MDNTWVYGHMPLNQRAKIFTPYAALKGFEELIREQENIYEEMPVLSDDQYEDLNYAVSSIRIGEDITAEVQLGDEEQPAVSVSIMENPDKINFDGCQQISMEDLLSPATAAAFYAEISANALPLLFFLMQIMPQNLLNLLINLN